MFQKTWIASINYAADWGLMSVLLKCFKSFAWPVLLGYSLVTGLASSDILFLVFWWFAVSQPNDAMESFYVHYVVLIEIGSCKRDGNRWNSVCLEKNQLGFSAWNITYIEYGLETRANTLVLNRKKRLASHEFVPHCKSVLAGLHCIFVNEYHVFEFEAMNEGNFGVDQPINTVLLTHKLEIFFSDFQPTLSSRVRIEICTLASSKQACADWLLSLWFRV